MTIHSQLKTTANFFVLLLITALISQLAIASEDDKRGLNWTGPSVTADTPFQMGDFRAVIIGNNHYKEGGVWKNLNTAVNDAKTVASLLQSEYGFQDVTLLKNAGRKEILGAFKDLSNRVEPNDNVLVYYAGHGHLEDDERRGYWIPSDGEDYDDTTFIRNSTVRDEINIIAEKTKHTLLISDSCFSGSLLRGGNRGPSQIELSQGYYTKVGNKRSVQVFAAGGNEYVDDNYRNSGHSPFTYFLVNELRNNTQKYISLSELATNIIKAVANNVDQTPEAGVLAGAGDELGEFIFARVSLKDNLVEVFAGRDNLTSLGKDEDAQTTEAKTNQTSTFLPAFRF